MTNYQIDEINLLNLFLKKKYRSYTVSFMQDGEAEKLTMDIPETKTPFGIEDWYGKSVINIELNKSKKEHKVIIQKIQQINNFFANIPVNRLNYFLPQEMIDKLDGLQFKPSLVQNKEFQPVLKTYTRLGKRSPLRIIKDGDTFEDDIKDQTGTFQVMLSTFWYNNTSFGLNWTVEHIELDSTPDEEIPEPIMNE